MDEIERNEERPVPVSRLAMAAFVLGAVSLLLDAAGISSRYHGLMLVGLAIGLVAMILGIIGFVVVQRSGGRLAGIGYAKVGFLMPAIMFGLGVLLPALARTRSIHRGITCGTNLSGLGKAMMMYANDYQGRLPCAGGKGTRWANSTQDWTASDLNQAFGLDPNGQGGWATVSSSLYLLIKYEGCTPKMFMCPKDKKVTQFNLLDYMVSEKVMTGLWDFGPEPWRHYSYSYHMPFGAYTLTTRAEAGMAVLADRNPWIAWIGGEPNDFNAFKPDLPSPSEPWKPSPEGQYGNSPNHQKDGQNVLYIDNHVEFDKRPFVGIDKDNIYTRWDGEDKVRGLPPNMTTQPADRKDSMLVHDPPVKR